MNRLIGAAFFVAALGSAAAWAGPAEDGHAAVEEWARIFNDGSDIDAMVAVYANEPLLWGTASRTTGTTPDDVRAYFTGVFSRKIKVQLGEHVARAANDNTVVDIGEYTFTIPAADGSTREVPARYLFVAVREAGGWKLVGHHSSPMPAPPQ